MSTTSSTIVSRLQPSGKVLSLRRIEIRWGYFFIAPWIIGFLVFSAFPILASLYLSFTNYTSSSLDYNWVGTQNYRALLSLETAQLQSPDQNPAEVLSPGFQYLLTIPSSNIVIGAIDPTFWKSLKVTLLFAVISLPIGQVIALFLAVLVNMKLPLVRLYRTIYYLPSIVPLIAGVLIFRLVLGRDIGWLNGLLKTIGITGPDWLNDERFVLFGLAIIGFWGVGSAMLIYLGGLQSVPTELYEAAKVDGATIGSRFRHITLPMISPVILYNLVIGLIGAFQYFIVAYVLSNGLGTPNGATMFYNLYLYKTAFGGSGQLGYASAMAWILLIIVVLITIAVFASSGNWVFYAGERRK